MKINKKKILTIVFLFTALFIMSFSNFVYSEEPVDSGLSIANVYSGYST